MIGPYGEPNEAQAITHDPVVAMRAREIAISWCRHHSIFPNGELASTLTECIAAFAAEVADAVRVPSRARIAAAIMNPCNHSLAERETMVADGFCPECMRVEFQARKARLRAALPPSAKLRLLADWFDLPDHRGESEEVQTDLRNWADTIDAALAEPTG